MDTLYQQNVLVPSVRLFENQYFFCCHLISVQSDPELIRLWQRLCAVQVQSAQYYLKILSRNIISIITILSQNIISSRGWNLKLTCTLNTLDLLFKTLFKRNCFNTLSTWDKLGNLISYSGDSGNSGDPFVVSLWAAPADCNCGTLVISCSENGSRRPTQSVSH